MMLYMIFCTGVCWKICSMKSVYTCVQIILLHRTHFIQKLSYWAMSFFSFFFLGCRKTALPFNSIWATEQWGWQEQMSLKLVPGLPWNFVWGTIMNRLILLILSFQMFRLQKFLLRTFSFCIYIYFFNLV